MHRHPARQVAALVLPVAKEQKETQQGKRNDRGKSWKEVRPKAARREAPKMSAQEKWRQAKAKPAKREALKMGCSPPGAEGGDMRFIPHCAPAVSELRLRAPPRHATICSIHERLPVQYHTVASSCAGSAQ